MIMDVTGQAAGVMDRVGSAGEAGHGHSEDKRQSLMPPPALGKSWGLTPRVVTTSALSEEEGKRKGWV